MAEALMVFCYDVSAHARRRKVARLLEARCVRVQHSVFEARMDRDEAHRLAARVARELGPDDSLRAYAITDRGLDHCRAFGAPPLPERQDFYLL